MVSLRGVVLYSVGGGLGPSPNLGLSLGEEADQIRGEISIFRALTFEF